MAGFEVIVRPMIFPNIRPAPARSLPPEDNPESGIAVIHGASGQHIDLAYSWGFSMSKNKPQETERRVDEARVYQKEDDGTVNRDNYVDIQVANKITMDETKGPGGGTPGVGSGTPEVGAPTTKSEMKEYFYERIREREDNIEIKRKDVILRNGEEVKGGSTL